MPLDCGLKAVVVMWEMPKSAEMNCGPPISGEFLWEHQNMPPAWNKMFHMCLQWGLTQITYSGSVDHGEEVSATL